jgi:hypothetical protein
MTFVEAKDISVYDLCVKLGGKCVQTNNGKHYALFHAPYRDDRHPSLTVDMSTNRWYDYAEDIGGDAVDLVRRKFEGMSAKEALAYLDGGHVGRREIAYKNNFPTKKEKIDVNQPCIIPLQNRILLDYVASRAVSPALAKRYFKEAHMVNDKGKPYFALAFPSRSGGFELNNPGLKGCVGPKDISVVGSGKSVFLFFEGMFDFLSHIQLYGCRGDATYVVMNSVTQVERAVDFIAAQAAESTEVQLWLDNDDAGRAASNLLLTKFPKAIDMASIYAGYKDLNDKLRGKIK